MSLEYVTGRRDWNMTFGDDTGRSDWLVTLGDDMEQAPERKPPGRMAPAGSSSSS